MSEDGWEPGTTGAAFAALTKSIMDLLQLIGDIMLRHERVIWLLDMSLGGILLLWFAIDLWPSEWSILIGCISVYLFVLVWTDG